MCQDSEEFRTNKVSEKNARFYINAQQCVEGELLFFNGLLRAQKDIIAEMEKSDKKGSKKYNEAEVTLLDIKSMYNAILEFKKNPKIKKILDSEIVTETNKLKSQLIEAREIIKQLVRWDFKGQENQRIARDYVKGLE